MVRCGEGRRSMAMRPCVPYSALSRATSVSSPFLVCDYSERTTGFETANLTLTR